MLRENTSIIMNKTTPLMYHNYFIFLHQLQNLFLTHFPFIFHMTLVRVMTKLKSYFRMIIRNWIIRQLKDNNQSKVFQGNFLSFYIWNLTAIPFSRNKFVLSQIDPDNNDLVLSIYWFFSLHCVLKIRFMMISEGKKQ